MRPASDVLSFPVASAGTAAPGSGFLPGTQSSQTKKIRGEGNSLKEKQGTISIYSGTFAQTSSSTLKANSDLGIPNHNFTHFTGRTSLKQEPRLAKAHNLDRENEKTSLGDQMIRYHPPLNTNERTMPQPRPNEPFSWEYAQSGGNS